MGILDTVLNVMHMNPDDDEDYYDDYYGEEIEEPKRKPKRKSGREDDAEAKPQAQPAETNMPIDINRNRDRDRSRPVANKVTPIRSSKKSASSMEVCVIKPTSFEDSREITETLLMGRSVILNVEGLDVDIAQRIIDFTSGACFAIEGKMQRVSNYILLIAPANVDISGDFQGLLGSYGTAIGAEYM